MLAVFWDRFQNRNTMLDYSFNLLCLLRNPSIKLVIFYYIFFLVFRVGSQKNIRVFS